MNKAIIFFFVVLTPVLSRCRHDDNHGHDHGEDSHKGYEHAEVFQAANTVFSNNYEMYVKYSVPVVDKRVDFTVHITELNTYRPIEQGSLTISLIQGNKGIRTRVDSMLRPGIFFASLQPKVAGSCRLLFEYKIGGHEELFTINDMEIHEKGQVVKEDNQHSEVGNIVRYLKEQAWNSEFEIRQIGLKQFKEVIHTSGKLLPANGDEFTIVAPYSGIVMLNSNIIPGVNVNKDLDILALSGNGLAAGNIAIQYNQLKTNFELAKANFERAQQLVDDKIVSEKDFLAIKTEYLQAKVAFENVDKSNSGDVIRVKAQKSGYVKEVVVQHGEFVEAGSPLIVITVNERLILQADVSQRHWHCLPEISAAHFLTPYDAKVHTTQSHNGKLLSYSRNASNSSWSVPIFFEINNWDDLIPGTYVEVYLMSKPRENVIAIPKTALIEEQSNYYVYVLVDGENYEKRKVLTGQTNGVEYEILHGLKSGEYIVTKGAYELKLASISSALPSHNHDH